MKRLVMTAVLFFFTTLPCFAGMISVAKPSAEILGVPFSEESYVIQRVPLNYPLLFSGETRNNFLRVQDFRGQSGWIHQSAVSDVATVVVTGNVVNIRRGPGVNHPLVFKAEKGVAFSLIRQQGKWLEISHESGRTGWIYQELTWGSVAPAE